MPRCERLGPDPSDHPNKLLPRLGSKMRHRTDNRKRLGSTCRSRLLPRRRRLISLRCRKHRSTSPGSNGWRHVESQPLSIIIGAASSSRGRGRSLFGCVRRIWPKPLRISSGITPADQRCDDLPGNEVTPAADGKLERLVNLDKHPAAELLWTSPGFLRHSRLDPPSDEGNIPSAGLVASRLDGGLAFGAFMKGRPS